MAPTTVLHDYYAILEVPQSADCSTIKSTYKKLAFAKHPDRRRGDPNATAEFQLLKEAYDQLYDVDKRREYDKIYQSTIRPALLKDKRVAELGKQLQPLKDKRKGLEGLLCNTKKDLIRLYAERDSLRGEKERIVKEKATEETWWLYICSFMPGKAAEFLREGKRREYAMVTIIGKQRTKERNIDLKLEEVRTLKGSIQSISSAEDKIKAEMRQVEQNWRDMILLRELEITLAEQRRNREQADFTRASTRAYFTRKNDHFREPNIWDF
ncbi:DnaJ domain protein [Penicillium herquei]|nr:DnaJ domain protein [Penicillium herquei]